MNCERERRFTDDWNGSYTGGQTSNFALKFAFDGFINSLPLSGSVKLTDVEYLCGSSIVILIRCLFRLRQ